MSIFSLIADRVSLGKEFQLERTTIGAQPISEANDSGSLELLYKSHERSEMRAKEISSRRRLGFIAMTQAIWSIECS